MKIYKYEDFDLSNYEQSPRNVALLRGDHIEDIMKEYGRNESFYQWLLSDNFQTILFVSFLTGRDMNKEDIKCIYPDYYILYYVIAFLQEPYDPNCKEINIKFINDLREYKKIMGYNDEKSMIYFVNKVMGKLNNVEDFFETAQNWKTFDSIDHEYMLTFLDQLFTVLYKEDEPEYEANVINIKREWSICSMINEVLSYFK